MSRIDTLLRIQMQLEEKTRLKEQQESAIREENN